MIYKIKIPNFGFNEKIVKIVEWNRKDKEKVKTGEAVCTIETSKTTFVIETEHDGFLRFILPAGAEIEMLKVVGYIVDDLSEDPFKLGMDKAKTSGRAIFLEAKKDLERERPVNATSKALKLAQEYGIDLSLINKDGIVRECDVVDFIGAHRKLNPSFKGPKKGKKEKIVILGAGGYATVCIELIRLLGNFEIVGLLSQIHTSNVSLSGVPVIGDDEKAKELFDKHIRFAVVGVGAIEGPQTRQRLFEHLKQIGFHMPNLIHPSSVIEPSVKMGEGNHIMAGCIIGTNVVVQNNCIVNTGAIISHDCVIKDNTHIAPGAILAGSVEVEENTLIGMGATIYMNVKIGRGVTILNGKDIFHDIADNVFVG